MRKLRKNFCFIAIVTLTAMPVWLPTESAAQDKRQSSMSQAHRATLKKYCFECHSSDAKEGGVDLESLQLDLATMESAGKWQKILGVLNSGEMPPDGNAQLTSKEKSEFLGSLSARIVTARKILSDSGGVITMRRLNRREYANTIRDLLGVEVDVEGLPDDENSGGFDTSGASLFLSSNQFEKYLEIASDALDEALTEKKPEPFYIHRQCEESANKTVRNRSKKLLTQYNKAQAWRKTKGKKKPTDFGFIDSDRVKFEEGRYRTQYPALQYYSQDLKKFTKTGAVAMTTFSGAFIDTTHIPPEAPRGDYLVQVRAGYLKGAPENERFLEYGFAESGAPAGEIKVLGCCKVSGTFENPSLIEFPITVGGPETRKLLIRQRQPNSKDYARRLFRSAKAAKQPAPAPALWFDWVKVKPATTHWPPKAQAKIFFEGLNRKLDSSYARKVIERFAWRAARNKWPSETYVDKLMAIYESNRTEGTGFVEAIKQPLSIVLASPSFLYLREPSSNKTGKRDLDDRELAIRLSYFLWSSPPDEELMAVAKSGDLRKPAVLRQQTERLLNSPKASHFVSGFTHQWLQMDRLDFFQFNVTDFREFDDSVRAASRNEIYQTVQTLIKENQPIGKLIKSDFVVINELLANYYKIPNVKGDQFRKVNAPKGSNRGGLLATAAVLAMGSDGERSSPVERGAWVMRKLLNDPPPPAPANVPQLSRITGDLVSARELQKLHQEEPQCAQCHRKIDPIGYGLENFDAAGRWRNKEKVVSSTEKRKRKTKEFPINSKGSLPDGTKFKSFWDLRNKLTKHEPDLARGFTEALIAYSLGRPYGFTDDELAAEIVEAAKLKNYGMREFIHTLVQSKQFKTK